MKLLNKMIGLVLAAQAGMVVGNWALAADDQITCPWIKSALAAEEPMSGSVTILSPKNDAVLNADAQNKLEYSIKLGQSGNHIHVYIDDQSPIVSRNVTYCPCTIDLPKLAPGKHTIVVKEAASSHALTGAQATVTVMVK